MTRFGFVLLAPALLTLTACPGPIENIIVPMWAPSPLQVLGCDGTADGLALPEDRPIAVCETSRNALAPVRESTDFLGNGSYDPNDNAIVHYDWRLVSAPEGTSQVIGGEGPDRLGFSPELAGGYTAQLIVTNDQCVMSEPCTVDLSAVPAEDLWVELVWEKPGDDMDLHLLNGASVSLRESNADCYYGNCIPDFGTALPWGGTDTADDPKLDLDDIDGTGPENINILAPPDGSYLVAVHDFPGSVRQGANDVTVRIHLDGQLAWEDTRAISGEDDFVPFAEIRWPSMEIVDR